MGGEDSRRAALMQSDFSIGVPEQLLKTKVSGMLGRGLSKSLHLDSQMVKLLVL